MLDYKQFEEFRQSIQKLDKDREEFMQACVKELAARLLAKVIKRTPVGVYERYVQVTAKRDSKHHKKGDVYMKRKRYKTGGTLRRGWTAGKKQDASEFVKSLQIARRGGVYSITISNPVEYAPYVEFGHRTRNHEGWVNGKFMLTVSIAEVENVSPSLLKQKLEKWLREVIS